MKSKSKSNYLKDPHDKFFESVFRETAIAKDHLESELPAELLKVIDLDSLQLDSTSYIDNSLKRYFSDVVYSAHCLDNKTEIKITFLYEHKSFTVAHPHLQLLQYMLNIWLEVEKENKNALFPVVIPLIVYHGEKKWNAQSFTSYFGEVSKALQPYIPSFEYILSDSSRYSVEELKEYKFKSAALKMVMYLLKTIFDLEKLEKDFDFFLKLVKINIEDEQERINLFNRMVMYIYANIPEKSNVHKEKINRILTTTGVNMTVLERMITDGEKKGRLEEKHTLLIRHLERKFGITGREKDFIESITDFDLLDSALDEILFADDKKTVLNCLKI